MLNDIIRNCIGIYHRIVCCKAVSMLEYKHGAQLNPLNSYIKRIFVAPCILLALFLSGSINAFGQTDTSTGKPATDSSKFDKFNAKAEHLFKILPVPIYSYSTEAGNIFGLAKFNLFRLSKKDTISNPSKLSGVVTFSTEGRINASVATELVLKEKKYIILSYINYKKTPEFLFGIGNDVSRDNMEEVSTERIKFLATPLIRVYKEFYAGIIIDISNYFNVDVDSTSFLVKQKIPGTEGGPSNGLGLALSYDNRSSRYNPQGGAFILSSLAWHPTFIGSDYQFSKFQLDIRKYFNPWLKHVIAIQGTTTSVSGTAPFYELALMGGDSRMRGYYEGAYRDKVLVDGQLEYRAPIWNIFGATAWIGTGRVASSYSDLSLEGFHLSYGFGIRIRVDSKNNTNLRLDFGFGPNNIKGTYINFAEAF
jgi:hypothetical protein